MGRDAARYGGAIALAVALGAVQLFVIPRRVSVATYGEYRVFLLYFAYVGALHVGLADGAYLRWAGRPPGTVSREWRRVARWLLSLEAALLALALAASAAAGASPMAGYLVAWAACALCANSATLAGYALQAVCDFRGAGRVAVIAPAAFVAAVVLLPLRSAGALIAVYVASFALAALAGAARLLGVTSTARSAVSTDPLMPGALVRNGLPVLGANIAAGLSQFVDRILVSVSVPVTTFALYGFASSTMVATTSATQALSRVALSHAARRPAVERARFLGGFHDVIAAGFGVAIAGVPLFEWLVARAVPAYAPALPIVRALVIGAPFWVAIHVVLVGTLQSYGMVRRQLGLELVGAALAAATCGACLALHAPLWSVALGASAAAVATWSAGSAFVRRTIPAPAADGTLRFALLVGAQAAALLAAHALIDGWLGQSLACAALSAVPTLAAARSARAHLLAR